MNIPILWLLAIDFFFYDHFFQSFRYHSEMKRLLQRHVPGITSEFRFLDICTPNMFTVSPFRRFLVFCSVILAN